MLKCKHVVEQADALVDGTPLSTRQRLALRLHLMMCHQCSRYVRQLRALLASLPRTPAPLDDAETNTILNKLSRS